jgi:hypothetical protein
MSEPSESDIAEARLAVDHAWQWFVIHATQRMQMLNFWLVSVAFLTAAYVTAVTNQKPQVAVVVAAAGTVLSVLFRRLEVRTRQLVRLGERALSQFQEHMALSTGITEMRILNAADAEQRPLGSYGTVIKAMQWFVTIAFLGAIAYAAWKWTSLK